MAGRFRLFAFGVQSGVVLFLATLTIVGMGLLGLGYFTANGLSAPARIDVSDPQKWVVQAIAVLNSSNIWSNIFFLAVQTCLVFVALHLTKFLYGRGKIIENVKQNVGAKLDETRASISSVLNDLEQLRTFSVLQLKDLEDESGRNFVRDNLNKAISDCVSLETLCHNLSEYLSKIEIDENLLRIAAAADVAAEGLKSGNGKSKRENYIAALDRAMSKIRALDDITVQVG